MGILVLVLMGAMRKELGIRMMSRLSILVLVGALILSYNGMGLFSLTTGSPLTIYNGLLRINSLGVMEIFIYIAGILLLLICEDPNRNK